jgi:DNA-binding NarL/FixJ family response regulator
MIRIIVADNHAIVRTGIRQVLARTSDIAVVAEAENGEQLLMRMGEVACDIVLQDMTMPGLAGAELIRRIKEIRPGLPVLVLSMHNEGQVAASALKAGASGYLTKDSDPAMLVGAIRKVAAGGRFIDPSMVDRMVFDIGLNASKPPHLELSRRELQIFEKLVSGLSASDIADNLALSTKTVSTYKARIMEKLGVDNIVGMVRYAVEHGLMPR